MHALVQSKDIPEWDVAKVPPIHISVSLSFGRVGPLIYARMLGLVQRRRSVCLRRPLRKENIAIAIASVAREKREEPIHVAVGMGGVASGREVEKGREAKFL